MDDWNVDLVLHVIQYLSVLDSNRLRLASRRCFYLVEQYRHLRGAEMVANVNQVGSLRSSSTTQCTAQVLTHTAASQQLQTVPNLALAFSTLSSTLPEDLALYLPKRQRPGQEQHQRQPRTDINNNNTIALGVVSGTIQSTFPTLDCRSNAGLMLAHLPNTYMHPFLVQFNSDEDDHLPMILDLPRVIHELHTQQERRQQPCQVIMVFGCGEEAAFAEDFVAHLQSTFPNATIVGGLCNDGYISESTEHVTRSYLQTLSSVDLMQWYRSLGGDNNARGGSRALASILKSWTKAQLLDCVWDLVQRRPYRLRILRNGGIFGVALFGQNVPVKSVVSRGVQSLTVLHKNNNQRARQHHPATTHEDNNDASWNYVVHQSTFNKPGDAEYLFRRHGSVMDDSPSYHIVRSIKDLKTGKIYTPNQIRNQFGHPDFVGLQFSESEGFHLLMPHPLSFNVDAFIFLESACDPYNKNNNNTDVNNNGNKSLEGLFIDFFDMTGEACVRDMDQTMQLLRDQTTKNKEELLGAIMISCSARGPEASSLIHESMADATRFARVFPDVPCLGFYANGEIGPLALAGQRSCPPPRQAQPHDQDQEQEQQRPHAGVFRHGQAALQGFTAVFALFVVPKFTLPDNAGNFLNDDPVHVRQFVQSYLGSA
ncbi:hypothetical protein ACA910_022562 [Epithemia clementina (nom. ined.)]